MTSGAIGTSPPPICKELPLTCTDKCNGRRGKGAAVRRTVQLSAIDAPEHAKHTTHRMTAGYHGPAVVFVTDSEYKKRLTFCKWLAIRLKREMAARGWMVRRDTREYCRRHQTFCACSRDLQGKSVRAPLTNYGRGQYSCERCMDEMELHHSQLRWMWYTLGAAVRSGKYSVVYDDLGNRVQLARGSGK